MGETMSAPHRGERRLRERGPARVVVTDHRADRRDHLVVRGADAEVPVIAEAGEREGLRAGGHLLAGPPGVGHDRLGVDVEHAVAVAICPNVRARTAPAGYA